MTALFKTDVYKTSCLNHNNINKQKKVSNSCTMATAEEEEQKGKHWDTGANFLHLKKKRRSGQCNAGNDACWSFFLLNYTDLGSALLKIIH